ncbi:MAG: PepSY domain-containing protein [Verrucomicrobiales bacterium]|nr:PepSY domain-containing protein [Verrucomicrobiales bacterium]
MKTVTRLLGVLLAGSVLLFTTTGCKSDQATLLRQAKITEPQARQLALERVPGGTIREAELEEEDGRLVWSMDIASPGTKDLTEILVDALTGEVVSTEIETPEDEAAEATEEQAAEGGTPWTATLVVSDEPLSTSGRNDYFILEPGYQLVFQGKEGREEATLTITVLPETREINGVSTRVVEERETVDGEIEEVSRNFMAFGTATRNIYYFGEEVDEYEDGQVVSHGGAWLEGTAGAKRGILLPGKIEVGARYHQEQAPGVAMDRAENVSVNESVKTPAGLFERCLKTKETTPLEGGTEYKYYAPGVGLVQDGNLRLVSHGLTK